jgi:hypothetical protein
LLKRFAHGVLGDLVESHPAGARRVHLGGVHQVPGDSLALAVGVGRQVHFLGSGCRRLDVLDHVTLVVGHAVVRRKVVVHIDGKLRLEQIAHVAHRRLDFEVAAQVMLDGAGLGRRLDDH